MGEWKEYKLGEVINLKRGYDLPKSKRTMGKYPIISSSGITDYHQEYVKEPPGVITGRYGTIGKVFYTEQPYWPLNTTLYVTDFYGNDSKFIYYFLQSFDFEKFSDKSTVPGINRNHLHTEIVNIPPLPEQKTIASVLCSLDDKIDLLHRQNATLEKMAETLFRKWFVEDAKEDWEEKNLREIIDVVIDNRGKTPPTVEFKTEYPLIEVNALNSNSCLIDYSVIRKYVNKGIFDTWFRKHLKVNDIIVSTVGTIGVFSIYLASKGCIAQNLVGLRSNSISSYFIYNFFKANVENLINLDIGGVQPSIKVPHLLGMTIKLPHIELINNYNDSVEAYFKKIAINQIQIQTLTKLRDTLLPKLMSGEVQVGMI